MYDAIKHGFFQATNTLLLYQVEYDNQIYFIVFLMLEI